MNPKDSTFDILGRYEDEECYNEKYEKIERLEREMARQKIEESRARSAAANKALNELCDALGVDLPGTSINAGTGHLHIPVDQVQMIANRIAAMNEANALIEGAL